MVDSVAEHQPASAQAYKQYLSKVYDIAPWGFVFSFLNLSDANTFVILYAIVAYYFSSKMARLVILLGPVASALGGARARLRRATSSSARRGARLHRLPHRRALFNAVGKLARAAREGAEARRRRRRRRRQADEKKARTDLEGGQEGEETSGRQAAEPKPRSAEYDELMGAYGEMTEGGARRLQHAVVADRRVVSGCWAARIARAKEFYDLAAEAARAADHVQGLSAGTRTTAARHCRSPSSSSRRRRSCSRRSCNNGQEIIVDDYREAYFWLRDHTPADARVMAWWDYGYQITGIGNRTTIADGNTWNHEHIATLGRILSAPEDEAHKIARHLADYVLVWAGGGGDDLAKSPHMARIGNSVYLDICDDPTCSQFGFYQGGIPTPMMEKCLLYKMVQWLRSQMGVRTVNGETSTSSTSTRPSTARCASSR